MATTMKLIAKSVLTTTATNAEFTSIPGTYTDLLLVMSLRSDRSGWEFDEARLSFNSSTANFSSRALQGENTTVSSFSNYDSGRWIGTPTAASATSNTFSALELYLPNYAGSANKSYSFTSAREINAANGIISVGAGLWSDTSAITTLKVEARYASFVSGSSFFLYGITKA